MHIIANEINGRYLQEILANAPKEIDWVKAAVAYAQGDPPLIKFCVEQRIPLSFFGRLDDSLPVSSNILGHFLKLGVNYQCKLVENFYHPKVIWIAGYGAYIGSANLSERAWGKNIECGVWFTQEDLADNNLILELDEIFRAIDEESIPLTEELYAAIKELEISQSGQRKRFQTDYDDKVGKFLSKRFSGLSQVVRKGPAGERRRANFLEEWSSTLQTLRKIATLVILDQNRPSWVKADVPSGVQLDQFLHAFYFTQVKRGAKSYEEFFETNKGDPDGAVKRALKWWSDLDSAPNKEDEYMYERAPLLKGYLAKETLLNLNQAQFIEMCKLVHAFNASARQTSNKELNLPEDTHLPHNVRADEKGNKLWMQRSGNGSGPLQVINYVLYGGSQDETSERVWTAFVSKEWHLQGFGLSQIGEIVGWAMPERYPPRNGRTSKALRALGFPVKVYGD